MRIAIDGRVTSRHYPGIGRYCLNLIDALLDARTDHHWSILYHPHSNPALAERARRWAGHPQVRFTAIPHEVRSAAEQIVLPAVLRQIKPDVVHAPYYAFPPSAMSSLLHGGALVTTLYDTTPHLFPTYWRNRALHRVITAWSDLAYRSASAVVTLSTATQRDLEALYHPVAGQSPVLRVTPCGADEQFLSQAALRQPDGPWPLSLMRPYALYVGSNKPHKNLARLVEAYATLCTQGRTEIDLVIAGRWDTRYPEAKEIATHHNLETRVHFLHDISDADLAALYRGTRFFVFPSLYEGFGLPVLEAMAAGVPVLTAASSSLPEVGGDAVLYCDPQQTAAIASGFQSLDSDAALRQRLGYMGHLRARSMTWAETARLTLACYDEAVATPRQ